jgi:hypothetical protein
VLIPLTIPPGMYRNGTQYQTAGRWYSGQLVRFFEQTIRPFGGWLQKVATVASGPGRGLLTWKPFGYARAAIFGTTTKLYVYDDDVLLDVTPLGLPPGVEDSYVGWGYGLGEFGADSYGVAEGAPATTATTWSCDLWGDHALACPSHSGTVYEYANDGQRAQPVANCPTGIGIFVTEQRNLVILGANGNPRLLMWSDFENNTDFTPTPANGAGDWRFQTDGILVAGRRVPGGAALIWTSTDLHQMRFIGGTLVFQFTRVEGQCGIASPLSVQIINGQAIWMGRNGFFLWDGARVSQLPCEIHDYVFGDINWVQAAKFHTGQVSAFNEVLFFYCSSSSNEIDRCVSYNHREGHWTIVDGTGMMARSAWADAGAFSAPLAVGTDGRLYQHETGWTANGTPIREQRYLQSGPIEIGTGETIIEASQLIPDGQTFGNMQLRFQQQFTPGGAVTTRGPYPVTRPYVDVRLTARQLAMTLESLEDEDFRFGIQRLEAETRGKR